MKKRLEKIKEKPSLYEKGSRHLWSDAHIAKQMLKAHLDREMESATRKYEFVLKSVDWIYQVFPPQHYKRLFDLGCGPGIYTELFYKYGYEVKGMDISSHSIEYAKLSAKRKNMNIQYDRGDYIESEFPLDCDLITLIYCDFGVLSYEERDVLLRKVYDSLLPNGCFVFDVFNEKKYMEKEERNDWSVESQGFFSAKEHLLLKSFYRYDLEKTFLEKYVVIENDDIIYYHVWEHVFTFTELEELLKNIGFQDISFYGDMTGKECDLNDETICIIARK